jgi:guanosine-3',5'-bis(diphosphate) 3'-pyrophosphohydrolase
MLLFLTLLQLIGNPIAAQPHPASLVDGEVMIDSFAATVEAVKSYSNNDPKVMKQCRQYLDEIRALQAQGKISEKDAARILDAVVFSAEKHRHETRKNPEETPYIVHPIGVSYTLATLGQVYDADVLIGALLHDTVEDTETTFEEIKARFGNGVEGYVREVTDDKSLPKEERKRLQIENAHHKSSGAALIKLSDKLYNLNDLTLNPPDDWSQERIDQYFLCAKQVVDRLPAANTDLKHAVDALIAAHIEKSRVPH